MGLSGRVQMVLVWLLVFLLVSGFADEMRGDVLIQSDGDDDGRVRIDQSQTIDGVTVTLDWAYADTSRIEIGVHVEAEDDNQRVNLVKPYLTSADSQLFGQWVVSGEGFNPETTDIRFTTFMREDVESISLQIDLMVAVADMPEDVPHNTSFRGGGSLFDLHPIPYDPNRIETCSDYAYESGVFKVDNHPIDTWWDRATIEGNGYEIVGPFDFEFELAVLPSGLTVRPDVAVTENGVELQLEDFIIRPPWAWAVMRTPTELGSSVVNALFGERGSLVIGEEESDETLLYFREVGGTDYCVLALFVVPPISPDDGSEEGNEAEIVETPTVEVQRVILTIPSLQVESRPVLADWVFEFEVEMDEALMDW